MLCLRGPAQVALGEVQQVAWTDERLGDLADRMDAGFARNDREIQSLRTEIRALRLEFKADIGELRTELKGDIDALRLEFKADIGELRTELKGDIDALRTELKGDTAALRTELKGDIAGLHALIVRFGVAILICLVTVIAALIGVIPAG